MTVAIGDATPSFSRPLNIVERYVCYGGGLANTSGANTYTELFLATALPTESCSAAVPQPDPEPEPEPEPVTPPTEDEEGLDSDDDTDDPSQPSSPPSTTPTSPTSPTNPSASTSRSLR